MFTIFALYAAAFWFGGYLRIQGVSQGEGENKEYYTGGKVIAIMFFSICPSITRGLFFLKLGQ